MKRSLWLPAASAFALWLVAGLVGFGEAAGKGGGKPPPPPTPADPAIAYFIGTPSTGTWGDLMVMDADGSNQTVVVPGGATRPISPSWSPDGKSLVYAHLFNGECRGLHVVSKDQSGNWGTPQPLVTPNQCIFGFLPAWSPDESGGIHTVAYASVPEGQGSEAIYLVKFTRDTDGRVSVIAGPSLLYANLDGIHETAPTWSPNGTKLAFIEADNRVSPFVDDLLLLDLTTTPSPVPTSLIPGSSLSGRLLRNPSWAKKKDLLVVSAAAKYPNYDLWCVNINDPSQSINLTGHFDQTENLPDVDPSWSDDDSKIIFSRGGVAMALTIDTTLGCPDSIAVNNASLSQIATVKGKKSMWGLDWRR